MKYTYRIKQDDAADNPRDWQDCLSTFYAAKNPRYTTGGKKDVEYSYCEDLEEAIKALRKEKAVIVEFENPNCGTCYAVVERGRLKKEYLDYGQTMRQALYHARQVAKGEIYEYLAWASGEVYGYIVEDEEGNRIDSRWGFYGWDGYKAAEEEAQSIVEAYEKESQEEEAQVFSRLQMVAGG